MGEPIRLPVRSVTSAPTACARLGYVSPEELEILMTIRELGGKARLLRQERDAAAARGDESARAQACAALERLRAQRNALEPKRERAWRRKMIALGHLEDEPFLEVQP